MNIYLKIQKLYNGLSVLEKHIVRKLPIFVCIIEFFIMYLLDKLAYLYLVISISCAVESIFDLYIYLYNIDLRIDEYEQWHIYRRNLRLGIALGAISLALSILIIIKHFHLITIPT